jgi:hypothetical protein
MWQKIIAFLTVAGIGVNVLLVAYTSNSLRDSLIIPMLAGYDRCDGVALSGTVSRWYSNGMQGCGSANVTRDAPCLSDEARALDLQIEWYADCPRNWRNCDAQIGGEEWLPATSYLTPKHSTTKPYLEAGLCDPSSSLYNEPHCHLCKERLLKVDYGLLIFVLLLEHALLMAVLVARNTASGKPGWVKRAEAFESARTASENVRESSMRRQTSPSRVRKPRHKFTQRSAPLVFTRTSKRSQV